MIECVFGFVKVRYHGLGQNTIGLLIALRARQCLRHTIMSRQAA